jgi:hypothetical protein
MTNRTVMNPIRKCLRYSSTTIGTYLSCSFWVFCNTKFTSILSFVRYILRKPTPSTIPDRFGKISILHHILHFQIFVSDQVINIYKLSTNLLKKISSLISYLSVYPDYPNVNPFSSLCSSLLLRKNPLSISEFRFRLSEMFRFLNGSSIRECSKMSNSHFYSYSFSNKNFILSIRNLKRDCRIPVVRFSFEGSFFSQYRIFILV